MLQSTLGSPSSTILSAQICNFLAFFPFLGLGVANYRMFVCMPSIQWALLLHFLLHCSQDVSSELIGGYGPPGWGLDGESCSQAKVCPLLGYDIVNCWL